MQGTMSLSGHRMVHVRFEGRSWDLPFHTLNVGETSDDTAVRRALAAYLNVAVGRLTPYVVERHANGNITIRPEAVFG